VQFAALVVVEKVPAVQLEHLAFVVVVAATTVCLPGMHRVTASHAVSFPAF
jgi:hypothetical protein